MGLLAGSVFGLMSAILYTAANVALRHCIAIDPFLVSAVKAIPTVVVLGPFLLWMIYQGEAIATSNRMIPRFMFAALVGQFIGNAAFQLALARIGLAVSVPITLGTMIVGAAILGRWILGEPVRIQTLLAMAVLLASIVVLSSPSSQTQGDAESIVIDSNEHILKSSPPEILLGSLFAASSGLAYALFGTTMRQAMKGGLSAPLTMFISGAVGTISLWSVSFYRLGWQSITVVPTEDWRVMFAAGVLNFVAFVALATSLKALPVVAVNLINASQVAMAAVAGIVFFAEPFSRSLIIGISLTFLGLLIMARRPKLKCTD